MPLLNINSKLHTCRNVTHSLSSCNGCQNGCNCHGQASCIPLLPIQTSNMLGTTTLSAPNQPFPSCKVEKFFN